MKTFSTNVKIKYDKKEYLNDISEHKIYVIGSDDVKTLFKDYCIIGILDDGTFISYDGFNMSLIKADDPELVGVVSKFKSYKTVKKRKNNKQNKKNEKDKD